MRSSRRAGGGAWRVRLSDRDRREALLDYCLRLGASAAVDEDGTLAVSFPEHIDDELGPYLERWSAVNRAQATVRPPAAPVEAGTPAPKAPRLGEILVGRGLIGEAQLKEALFESRHTNDLLGRVLLNRGWVFEEELARTLADQQGLPYVSLMRIGVNPRAAYLLPREVGLRYAAIPVRFEGESVVVAFADPSDQSALDAVGRYLPSIVPVVAELSDISMMWRSSSTSLVAAS